MLELRSTGAPMAAFEEGPDCGSIVDQGEGELGERLARAGPTFPTHFIGSDAPDLTPALLQQAANALDGASAAIDPAEDGGYWLLGLSHAVDRVFEGVDWGTNIVFGQTMDRLTAAEIDPVLLPELADCDRPEDLSRWPGLFPG